MKVIQRANARSTNFVRHLGTASCVHEPDRKQGLRSTRVDLQTSADILSGAKSCKEG